MRDAFTSTRTLSDLPRLPLKGSIDLTYRCNNRCRHCWLWTDDGRGELTKEEIFDIVDQARAMGCREWAISGGEKASFEEGNGVAMRMTRIEDDRCLAPRIRSTATKTMDHCGQAVS